MMTLFSSVSFFSKPFSVAGSVFLLFVPLSDMPLIVRKHIAAAAYRSWSPVRFMSLRKVRVMNPSPHHRSPLRWAGLKKGAAIAWLALALCYQTGAQAASPAGGSLSATDTAPLHFTGQLTGTGATNQMGVSTGIPGFNVEYYTLTLSPGDYTGKTIATRIDWQVEANDYDLYVHQGGPSGPIVAQSANGAPQTSENTVIVPGGVVGTAQTYTVEVDSFAATTIADHEIGTLQVAAITPTRTATYTTGDMTFSPNVAVLAPVTTADGEPSSRTDLKGNFYVSGIRGVPAGIDLWYTNVLADPLLRQYHYQGQPDAFSPTQSASVGGDGGGDVDLAVTLPTDGSLPVLAFSSLVAANISFGNTLNPNTTAGMPTYNLNPAGNLSGGIPVDDRQWMAPYGKSIYILYRTIGATVGFIQRSDPDPKTGGAGFVYLPAVTTGPSDQTGGIDVDQGDGTVYAMFNNGQIAVGMPPTIPSIVPGGPPTVVLDPTTGTPAQPATYTYHQAASDPNGVAHIFTTVKVAKDHTVYVVYSNEANIYLVYSTDHGANWSAPVRVNSTAPGSTLTNLFPWIAVGSNHGAVGIAWYGTTDPLNDGNANWKVYYARCPDVTAATPAFAQVTVSDHFIHGSNISEGGTTGTANRNLLDYFQVSFDPNGAAVIGYTDDHNDFNGNTFISHQISGTTVDGGTVTAPAPIAPQPPSVPAPSAAFLTAAGPGYTLPSFMGAQVTDFYGDQTQGLLVALNNPDPTDIVAIKYGSVAAPAGPAITATMSVSLLSPVPPLTTWRMIFAANVPYAQISDTGNYDYGVSDRADQFYVQATTGAPGTTPTYTYGTVMRTSSGSLTYTPKGTADAGSFDSRNKRISIRVSVFKLNALIHTGTDALGFVHAPIASGSVIAGLRGTASTQSGAARGDETRGGTEFTIQ